MTKLYLISFEMRWLHGRHSYWAVEEMLSWSRKKDQLWPSGMWYCVMVSHPRRPVMTVYDNFKWHKMYSAFMSLEDLSLSLSWQLYLSKIGKNYFPNSHFNSIFHIYLSAMQFFPLDTFCQNFVSIHMSCLDYCSAFYYTINIRWSTNYNTD